MSAGPLWQVRAMGPGDLAEVIALAAGEPTAPHWPPFEYSRMLDVIAELPVRRAAWVLLGWRPGVGAVSGVALGTLAGFGMASHVAGICDLEAVVVHEAWRGGSGGEALVEAAAGWGRELGASRLELEVRASNAPAVRLYRRMGFGLDGTRPGYYHNPEEEAVLMSLPL